MDQVESYGKWCPLHRRPIQLFCIDQSCQNSEKQCCPVCVLSGNPHQQHEVIFCSDLQSHLREKQRQQQQLQEVEKFKYQLQKQQQYNAMDIESISQESTSNYGSDVKSNGGIKSQGLNQEVLEYQRQIQQFQSESPQCTLLEYKSYI